MNNNEQDQVGTAAVYGDAAVLPRRETRMKLPRPLESAIFKAVQASDQHAIERLKYEHPEFVELINRSIKKLKLLDKALRH